MPAEKEKLLKELSDYGVHMLTGEITEESTDDAIKFILEANLNKTHKVLNLIVNSGGGDCTAGFALIDVMLGSKIPVHTTGLGILASMGLVIFIAGEKGKRVLTPNTLIMSHQYLAVAWGKEHELLANRKQHDILTKMVLTHYRRHTKLKTDEAIRKYLLPAHDVWLKASEAKRYGLCDQVRNV